MRKIQHALVAFGGNLQLAGVTLPETVSLAANVMAKHDLRVVRMSRTFYSPAFPKGSGPDYVNAAAVIEADLSPQDILARLHLIESAFQRERQHRWGARTLDLDLLAVGDLVLPDEPTQERWRNLPAQDQTRLTPDQLILPHPRLQDRAFVLVPLADVAPDWRHPGLGLTVLDMLARLDSADIAALRPL